MLSHRGRPDQGAAAIAWPTTDVFSDNELAARRLLVNIMQLRLTDELRVRAGATYSPSTTAHASLTFPGYGYVGAYAEIPPDKAPLFYDTVAKVAADLKEKGPTADEFERARKPELDSLERAVETNGFWSSFLAGAQADERRLELIRQARPEAGAGHGRRRSARRAEISDRCARRGSSWSRPSPKSFRQCQFRRGPAPRRISWLTPLG